MHSFPTSLSTEDSNVTEADLVLVSNMNDLLLSLGRKSFGFWIIKEGKSYFIEEE